MQERTYRGEWWIPGSEDDAVAGEMTYRPQDGAEVELFDSLDGSLDPLRPRDLDLVFGDVFEEGLVTLRNVHSFSGKFRGTSNVKQSFRASTVFIGENIGEKSKFSKLEINFPNLHAFTSHNVIEDHPPSEDDPHISTEISGTESTEVEVDGTDISLSTGFTVNTNLSGTEYSRRSKFTLRFSNPLSYREIRQQLNFLQRYVSLAYQDPVYPSSVTLDDNIEVLYQITQYHSPPEIRNPHQLAFRQTDIDLRNSLDRWVDHSKNAETLHDMYFSIVYDPDMSVQYDFLSLAIAIESYFRYIFPDRKPMEKEDYTEFREGLVSEIPDDIPVKKRVKNLLESIGNDYSFSTKIEDVARGHESIISELIDIDKTIKEITATRHGIVHSLDMESDSRAASELRELAKLTDKLRLIIEAILYNEIGVDDEQIVEILEDQHKWIIK